MVSASLDQTVRVWDISGKLPPYVYVQNAVVIYVLSFCIAHVNVTVA